MSSETVVECRVPGGSHEHAICWSVPVVLHDGLHHQALDHRKDILFELAAACSSCPDLSRSSSIV